MVRFSVLLRSKLPLYGFFSMSINSYSHFPPENSIYPLNSPITGDNFLNIYLAELLNPAFDATALEQNLGEQAGLFPLPLGRMFRQAGRPMTRYRSKPDPTLHESTIQRNLRNQQTIENWNPLGAEAQQRLNNTNPTPRSRPSAPSESTTLKYLQELGNTLEFRKRQAFNRANQNDPMWTKGSKEFADLYGQEVQAQRATDPAVFMTPQERAGVKNMIFDYLDSTAGNRAELKKQDLPIGLSVRFPRLSNDLLYEWNARRQRALRDRTVDMIEMSRESIRGI